jgi:DNA polymerase V
MGAPAFQSQALFDEHSVHVYSANFALYGDMSHRVMSLLESFCPEIEIYSIDEAFLDFSSYSKIDLVGLGKKISSTIKKHTGIPVSIGFGSTKSLAKVANKICKKYPTQTGGVHFIDTEAKRIKALKWLPVGDVWGIGAKHAQRLANINIKTTLEFAELSDEWIKKHLSVVELRIKQELNGDKRIATEVVKAKKNIATTRSFEKSYKTIEELNERVVTFSVVCAEKLRQQHSCCNAIQVFVRTNGFKKDAPQYANSIVVKLPFPTNSSIELAKFAQLGLKLIFKKGYEYKKAGVVIMDFTPENSTQLNVFENSNEKHKKLMLVLDEVNNKVGKNKLKLASQDKNRVWKMRQEKLSPRYTTKFKEIITVAAK